MFKEIQVVYGPVAELAKEGEHCLYFDFPASPAVVDAFLQNHPHLADEAVVRRFKVQSDFTTPVIRDQVEEAIYGKAVERLTQDQAAQLCEEHYYELFPALKDNSDTKDLSPVAKADTDLAGFIRQVSAHWLIPIDGTTDFWLIRGSFKPEKDKDKEKEQAEV